MLTAPGTVAISFADSRAGPLPAYMDATIVATLCRRRGKRNAFASTNILKITADAPVEWDDQQVAWSLASRPRAPLPSPPPPAPPATGAAAHPAPCRRRR